MVILFLSLMIFSKPPINGGFDFYSPLLKANGHFIFIANDFFLQFYLLKRINTITSEYLQSSDEPSDRCLFYKQ